MRHFINALAACTALVTASVCVPPAIAGDVTLPKLTAHHVLLISIDGMHAVDLTNYISSHRSGALARLAERSVTYPNALTTAPSDSFPGLLALVTGGTPKSADVFYDVSYDRNLYAPGSNCTGTPGTMTHFDEADDKDMSRVDAGGTLGNVMSQIDPTQLPMQLKNGACVTVYPHDTLKVNTIFEVIRHHHGYTAWADKHPAYDLVNGPSGKGVNDLFTPEVNSNDSITGADTTKGFHSVQRNDELKVQAVLNEIDGVNSTGTKRAKVPAIFGMNFQAVSVGQKLAKGNTADPLDFKLVGGYADAIGKSPNNGLQSGLDYVDGAIGRLVAELKARGLFDDTAIVITAKHGQSPIDVKTRVAADDGAYANMPGLDFYQTDDVALIWMKKGTRMENYGAAKAYLESQMSNLGIVRILDNWDLANLYRDPFRDNKTPDFIAISQPGLIYTGGTKLAEHGGFAHNDRNVALMISNPSIIRAVDKSNVETRQVAPTILKILGLDPAELKAVGIEGTTVLPSLNF
jgi:hypothetical protein